MTIMHFTSMTPLATEVIPPPVDQDIFPVGIDSTVTFGNLLITVQGIQTIFPNGIDSTLTFGDHLVETYSINESIIGSSRNVLLVTGTATSQISLNSDGTSTKAVNENVNSDDLEYSTYSSTTWYTPQPSTSIGDDYDVYVEIDSEVGTGDITGTFDSWQSLGTDRTWSASKTGQDEEAMYTVVLNINIRDTATQTIQATGQITLRASIFGV